VVDGNAEHTVAEAERLDMGIDMTSGTGWPFGGPLIDEAFREFRWLYSDEIKSDFPQMTEQMVYKQNREYVNAYPDKVIFAWSGKVNPLAVLMAGGAYLSPLVDEKKLKSPCGSNPQ
jgi:hypothetical protein